MNKGKKQSGSLEQAIRALNNLIKALFEKNKWLYLFLIYITWLFTEAFKNSDSIMIFILCTIISIISWAIYIRTKSYSETALSFILGLFTVFSTDWDSKIFMLFISFYLIFNIITFIINSINLSAQKETILIQAALKYREQNYDTVLKKLDEIASTSTESGQLGTISRAECIRFLSFRKLKIEDLTGSLKVIELIKTVQQCELKEALILFYNLYTLDVVKGSNKFSEDRLISMLDEIVVLPLSHEEFFYLFMKLKKHIMNERYTFFELMNIIREKVYNGQDINEIEIELT